MSSCYMCDEPATSVEHVPPKCLFPEQKDLPKGHDLRKSLITVPSCELHNSSKSHDDEYLLYCLTQSLPTNAVGDNQFNTKVSRSIQRRPALMQQLTQNTSTVLVENMETGQISQTTTLDVDAERIDDCLRHIAHAVYFSHFGERWHGKVNVHANFMISLDPHQLEWNAQNRKMDEMSEALFKDRPKHGENPEVFIYQVIDDRTPISIRMCFYGENRVTATYHQHG